MAISDDIAKILVVILQTAAGLLLAQGDKEAELRALMDAADRLADEVERRKFG